MAEFLKDANITNLDAQPIIVGTAGEGAPGTMRTQDGFVTPATLAVGSTYRLCRIPIGAKIKSVVVATDGALDSNGSPTLRLDFNIAFSDSTTDGTAAANQGTIPQSGGAGTVTTVASYTNANKLFGASVNLGSGWSAAVAPTSLLLQGGTSRYNMAINTQNPLWNLFGFTANGGAYGSAPGGNWDILVYVATAAATPVTTSHLYVKVDYVLD
jgi:hypothetical protein